GAGRSPSQRLVSQSRTVWSNPHDASVPPSGENATASTRRVCPLNEARSHDPQRGPRRPDQNSAAAAESTIAASRNSHDTSEMRVLPLETRSLATSDRIIEPRSSESTSRGICDHSCPERNHGSGKGAPEDETV